MCWTGGCGQLGTIVTYLGAGPDCVLTLSTTLVRSDSEGLGEGRAAELQGCGSAARA